MAQVKLIEPYQGCGTRNKQWCTANGELLQSNNGQSRDKSCSKNGGENMEVWKDVPGYVGKYEASNKGGLRSKSRTIYYKDGRIRKHKGRMMEGTLTPNGYLQVSLCKNNERISTSIHRVVALTFLGKPKKDYVVNHKDGNRTHNVVENLEWVTQQENVIHAIETGLSTEESRSILGKVDLFIEGEFTGTYESCASATKKNNLNYWSVLRTIKQGTPMKNGTYAILHENCNDYPEKEYNNY